MNRSVRNERGMALAVAIFMLVIVGALVAGALFIGTQDQRSSENTRRLQQSFGIADQGAFAQVRNWNNGWSALATYPTTASTAYPTAGTTATIAQTAIAGLGSYSGTIYHLGTAQYLVDITGGDTASRSGAIRGGGARQRIGLLVRAVPSTPLVPASFTTQGSGTGVLRGGYTVDGTDTPPPGWSSCGAAQPSIPGMVTSDTTKWTGLSKVTGGPPAYTQDPTVTAAKLDTIGNTGITYAQLSAMASITLAGGSYLPAPVISGSTCVTANTLNWGAPYAPTGPCGYYMPIVHITGDLVVRGTSGVTGGQGILLIDGNVKAFNFRWDGMVIVRGSIDSTHFFRVDGAVQEQNATNRNNQDVWDVQFVYSTCALQKVFAQIPNGVSALRSRSWAELY